MLKSEVYVNGVGYVAKRDYVYRYNVNAGKTSRRRMTDEDKIAIKGFEPDVYNDLVTWEFLDRIYRGDC